MRRIGMVTGIRPEKRAGYEALHAEPPEAELAEDPSTQRWWSLTDPCQFRLPNGDPDEQWTAMRSVFFMA
jgi:L-rhamnose mutarotase